MRRPVPTTTTVAPTTTASTIPPGCCGAHRMVLETTTGGRFALGGLPETELPAGTRIVLDVGPQDAECRHAVSVPPGGFAMPPFCEWPFPFTGDVVPRGCTAGTALGAGTAWDGGVPAPDPNLAVVADTSDGICNPPGEACLLQERAAAGNVLGSAAAVFGDGVTNAPGLHLSVALPVVLRLWDVQEAVGEPTVCLDLAAASRVAEGVATIYSMHRLTTGRARALRRRERRRMRVRRRRLRRRADGGRCAGRGAVLRAGAGDAPRRRRLHGGFHRRRPHDG